MDKEKFERIEAAVSRAIDHVIKNGCDDIFKPPVFTDSIEHAVILARADDFRKRARAEALEFIKRNDLSKARIGDIHYSLVVKDHFTFRKVSWIDPFDLIKYLATAVLLFDEIEASRICLSENVVHSHRKNALAGGIFDEKYGYKSFRKASGEASRARIGQWKVVTDISNFFDRIGNHPLENHLLNSGCDRDFVTLMREILFFWAGDRRSFGVPVGSDASRILCEAALINVDRKLREAGVTFLRYVDDIRIFAESRAKAYCAVELLTSLLAEEGLSLNSKKTNIYRIIGDDEVEADPNAMHAGEHERIDETSVVVKVVPRTVSGRSTFARYYKKPGEDAIKALKQLHKGDLLSEIEGASDDGFDEVVRKAVKFFVYADQDSVILQALLDRRLGSVFYIVDAMMKEADRFSEERCSKIKETILRATDFRECAYPFKISLLRLCADKRFQDNRLIEQIVDSHRFVDNLLFLREAISIGASRLDRARVRKLALEHFRIVPDFVKRAIFKAVKDADSLSDDEKRPLLKNMLQATDDWFVQGLRE